MLIAIEGIEFHAYHGVYEFERENGRRYIVDIYLNTNQTESAHTDRLHDTIDYEQVVQACTAEMEIPSKLIEHAAQRIVNRLAAQFPTLAAVKVRLSKMKPPVTGHAQRAFVEIEKKIGWKLAEIK